MKYYFTFAALLLISIGGLSAQEYGLYHSPQIWNANLLNPGLMPRQEFVVMLPSLHSSYNTMAGNGASLFQYDEGSNTHFLNVEQLLDGLDRDLVFKSSTIVDALGVGMRAGRFFFSLSTTAVGESQLSVPETLLRTVWEGTENYLDTPLGIGPSAEAIVYQKVGLGTTFSVNDRLSVGLRVNRLLGAGGLQTERNTLTLTQSSDIYQTTAEIDYRLNYYSGGLFNTLNSTVEGFENFEEALTGEEFDSGSEGGFRQINQQNNGWSVDFGAEYLLGERLRLSAALTNLGSIRWKNNAQELDITGELYFDGVDVINLEEGEDFEILPGLDTAGTFTARSGRPFSQSLRPRSYLSAHYELFRFLEVGGLLYNELAANNGFTALSLSTQLRLGRAFSLGGVYNLQNQTFNTFGGNLMLKLGPLQLYGLADNLSSVFNPEKLGSANFRFGLNLAFGSAKAQERIIAARTTPVSGPNRIAENSPATENPAVATEEAAPAPTREETRPAPLAGSPQRAEGLRLYNLELQLLDADTRQAVPRGVVDVYQELDNGGKQLVYTGRFEKGALEVPLSQSEIWHSAEVTSFNHDTLFIRFQPTEGYALAKAWYMRPRSTPYAEVPEDELGRPLPDPQGQPMATPGRVEDHVTEETSEGYANSNGRVEESPGRMEAQRPLAPDTRPGEEEAPVSDGISPNLSEPLRSSSAEEIESHAAYPDESETYNDAVPEPITESEPPAYDEPEPEQLTETEPPAYDEPEPEQLTETEPPAYSRPEPGPEAENIEPPATAAAPPARTRTEERQNDLYPKPATHILTARTSLRAQPDSQSEVISRMSVGTELRLLEKTNKWWWKVSMGGWDGYVKAALLRAK